MKINFLNYLHISLFQIKVLKKEIFINLKVIEIFYLKIFDDAFKNKLS